MSRKARCRPPDTCTLLNCSRTFKNRVGTRYPCDQPPDPDGRAGCPPPATDPLWHGGGRSRRYTASLAVAHDEKRTPVVARVPVVFKRPNDVATGKVKCRAGIGTSVEKGGKRRLAIPRCVNLAASVEPACLTRQRPRCQSCIGISVIARLVPILLGTIRRGVHIIHVYVSCRLTVQIQPFGRTMCRTGQIGQRDPGCVL